MNCRICGNPICNQKTKHKKLCKDLKNGKYKPTVCYDCLEKEFGEVKRAYSNKMKMFIYEVDLETAKKMYKHTGSSLQGFIDRHGEEEGKRKYEEYVKKQKYSCTLEYFVEKYGEEGEKRFNEYNQSRAITLDNMIKKYGKDEGIKRFNEYKEKQKYAGCSLEYFVEKYGEEGEQKYKEVNKSKALTLENMIKRYGEEEGREKYLCAINNHKTFSSKMADDLFLKVYEKDKGKIYTNIVNKEYGIINEETKQYYKYDYTNIDKQKIIEFNGNIFHGNPKMYNENDCPNPFVKDLTAKEMWKKDKEKIETVKKYRGFDVLVIWEDELNEDYEKTLRKCFDFLEIGE